ncbi:MAG: DUF2341 domain-containing protein [Deltaproteobacteria bacterium]|nr:DUF2341 domain-containing protein [Deltaproteobacteria bacterium]
MRSFALCAVAACFTCSATPAAMNDSDNGATAGQGGDGSSDDEDANVAKDAAAAPDTGAQSQDGSTRPSENAGGWWKPEWKFRALVEVSPPQNASLADFPLLVRVPKAKFGSKLREDAADMRFVSEQGNLLAAEREDSSKDFLFWVKAPEIPAHGSVLKLWMYFGNPEATVASREAQAQTWDATFAGVWHLFGPQDSSAQKADATTVTGTYSDSKIGRGLQLDADKQQQFSLPEKMRVLSGVASTTVSSWIKLTDARGNMGLLAIGQDRRKDGNTGHPALELVVGWGPRGGAIKSRAIPNTELGQYDSEAVANEAMDVDVGEWTHVAVVSDLAARVAKFYRNGVLTDTLKDVKYGAPAFDSDLVAESSSIGSNANGCCYYFHGAIDEVRLQTRARSDAWIKAEYAFSADPTLVKLGDAEALP